jgi:peptidyl-prolyl cis-trans isomerase SurA
MAQLPRIVLLPQFSEMGGGAILAARTVALLGSARGVDANWLKRIAGMKKRVNRFWGERRGAFALVLLAILAIWPAQYAQAQTIVASVNGDPITSLDLAEREKLLRAIGQPSSPSAALESLIESRVKANEINKFGIKVSPNEFGPTLNYYAEKGHMTVAALTQRVSAAHIEPKHVENFFAIQQAFTLYARARNRAVEVSQQNVDAEVARDKKLANEQSFTLRQVVLILSTTASESALQDAAKKMEGLRARFTSCDTGVKAATESGQFVVREPITRSSSQLGEQLVALLDKTPVGHLTPPSRDSTGLVAIAICARKAAGADAAKEVAQQKLLQRIVEGQAQKIYEELRSHAVIVKKGQ